MISVVSITARKEPMWDKTFNSLKQAVEGLASLPAYYGEPPKVEWIVVDAGLWYDPTRAHKLTAIDLAYGPSNWMSIKHVPPKPSACHGPYSLNSIDVPDQNGARNTGILYASGDYLVFLDDCTVVHPNFLCRAAVARSLRYIVRFPHRYQPDFHISEPPEAPRPLSQDIQGPLQPYRKLEGTSLRGSGVGYPLEALLQVNGFDEAYAGEPKEDLEIGVRLVNAGWKLWEDPTTIIIESVFQEPLYRGLPAYKNEALLSKLIADKDRTQPYGFQLDLRGAREKVKQWRRG